MSTHDPSGAGGLTRRAILKSAAALGGLALCVRESGGVVLASQTQLYGAAADPGGVVDNPLVFVSIHPDDTVLVTVHRPEMGQGIRTSLALVVADELEADWPRVRVTQAPADEARYGSQDTDGSRSMRHFFQPMRRVGAAARMMLEAAAAARWGVPASEVVAERQRVLHRGTDRRLSYGELAGEAMHQPIPEPRQLRLKDPAQFRYIGKSSTRSVDGGDIVAGRAAYGIDTRLDGMLYAVVARPAVLGGKLVHYDAQAALAVPGVVRVVEIPSHPLPAQYFPLGGVAVLAGNTWAAIKGREALKVQWDEGPNRSYDSRQFETVLQNAVRQPAKVVRNQGDAVAALQKGGKRLEAEYYLPFLAHASMEPPAATARILDGRCEVWAPVQAPQATRDLVTSLLGMKESDVTVNVTLLGGAFGRKSLPDFAGEAALLSKAMQGRPVKVMWTREDDIRHDYYQAVSLQRLEAVLGPDGMPLAWLHRSAAPTENATFEAGAEGEDQTEYGMGMINIPLRIPNVRLEIPPVPAYTRIGWFRSVYNIAHGFAIQSFLDELAHAAGRDPRDYQLELIGPPRRLDPRSLSDEWNYGESPVLYPLDTGRLRAVIERATSEAGWGRSMPKGQGLGLAATYSFMSYAAAVIEVRVGSGGEIVIPRVDLAFDCGAQVNPDRIRAQLEGACIMGLTVAMHGEITFKDGRVQQSNFNDFPVLRMPEAPREIRLHLQPASFEVPPGGVGEPGLPPIAPALCNAIFAATGRRLRRLPIGNPLSNRQSKASPT
ncbi:MAG: xanthine dehydrogenase family protein molybdopterin-binding subunit [Gammaproteobacteria bacterium]|nr:xanthine dehydrogenase family protein molybdopterin-binding subunit [Gammaproteobacteria bacterium]